VADATMGAILARSYARYPRRPAVLEEGHSLTYRELQEVVHRTANALVGLGARKGDRVVLWLDNGCAFLAAEHALFLCGLVRTALSPRLHVDEVVGIVNDCRPSVVITDSVRAAQLASRRGDMVAAPQLVAVGGTDTSGVLDHAPLLAAASAEAPDVPLPTAGDLAALLYTSGTTGRPKAAMLTHRNWVAMVSALMAELPLIDDTDVVLHSAPMSHLSGSIGSAYCARGAATMTLRRFDAVGVLDTVGRHRVTALPMVPTMLASLTAAAEAGDYDLSSLRAVPYGGSAVSAQLLHRAYSVFGDVLVQVYGLSEALVPLAVLSPSGHRTRTSGPLPARLSSAGRPTPLVDLRIVSGGGKEAHVREPGEIQVRGDTVMSGYWDRAKATAEVIGPDGWVRTGDIGYRDDEGYLYIVDRESDIIVSGGYNIYPGEVERVIQSLHQVDEVVVVGAPHERWGEGVTAVITLKEGHHLTAEQVIDVCRQHLASYKKPTSVAFVDQLPKNSSGKLLRRSVRDAYWQGHDRKIGQ
jgi:acyl-CoA synthetase (AMP-forming)/AMP-acid ligase II